MILWNEILLRRCEVVFTTTQLHSTKSESYSGLIQIPFTACWKFVMIRTSASGPGCKQGLTQLTFARPKLIIETIEKGVFIVNFEHLSHLFLLFLLLTLNK